MNKQEAIENLRCLSVELEQDGGKSLRMKEAIGTILKECESTESASKPKTGRVMSVDDLEKGDEVFTVMPNGTIHSSKYILDMDIDDFGGIEYGNCFYDKASAEREVTRRKVVHKARQQFGDGFLFTNKVFACGEYRGIHYQCFGKYIDSIEPFIDSLSEEERESLR